MTKSEWQNVAKATPVVIIILFYWGTIVTGSDWQTVLEDYWGAFVIIAGIIAVIGSVAVAASSLFQSRFKRRHKQ